MAEMLRDAGYATAIFGKWHHGSEPHTKRGNTYLRTLFVQAAHIVLVRRPHGARLSLWPWIEAAGRRLHRNMLVIALANKLARIAWAVLARGHGYQPRNASHAA
jgi:transposase